MKDAPVRGAAPLSARHLSVLLERQGVMAGRKDTGKIYTYSITRRAGPILTASPT